MACQCCDSEAPARDYYGTSLCEECIEMDRDTDWDAYEEEKRRRIAEQNEY